MGCRVAAGLAYQRDAPSSVWADLAELGLGYVMASWIVDGIWVMEAYGTGTERLSLAKLRLDCAVSLGVLVFINEYKGNTFFTRKVL